MSSRSLLIAVLVLGVGILAAAGPAPARAETVVFEVSSSLDAVDISPGDGACATATGVCTLRAAIMEANAHPGKVHQINVSAQNIALSLAGPSEDEAATGDLDVRTVVSITGDVSPSQVVLLDGGSLDRIFHVQPTGYLELQNVGVKAGKVSGGDDGGGVLNSGGTLVMRRCLVQSNLAEGFGRGGGISNEGNLEIYDSSIEGNVSFLGGGIYNRGRITIAQSSVTANTVSGEGGGIFNYLGTVDGTQVTIEANKATANYGGGGIYNKAEFSLSDSGVLGNSAGWVGGGIANVGIMNLTRTEVSQNTSQGPGGGIYSGGTMTMMGGLVSRNTSSSGGGISNYSPGDMTLDGVRIADNSTAGFGGGAENASKMSLSGVTVEANDAVYGGGVANTAIGPDTPASLKISGSTLRGNTASDYGGGLITVYGTVEVRQSLLAENIARLGAGFTNYFGTSSLYETTVRANSTLTTATENAGGGVYAVGAGTVTLERCTIVDNAAEYGAGFFIDTGTVVLSKSTVSNNRASASGGGLYNLLPASAGESSRGLTSSPIAKINPSLKAQLDAPQSSDVSLTVLVASTISGNEAGTSGGGIYNTSQAEITGSTIAFNKSADSDGVFNDTAGRIVIGNTILRKSSGTAPTCAGGGLIESRGFNLEDGNTCRLSARGDIVGSDPLLGPLADNGGEVLTHALLPGSPAIDAGSNILCGAIDGGQPTDQRGQARAMDGKNDGGVVCDMGAFELQGPTKSFGDVPESQWAYGYIEWLYEDGYVAGCSATPRLYCPGVGMNRAEASVFTERGVHGAGYQPAEPSSSVFTDVPLGLWFTKWVQQLWVDGFTAGCSVDGSGNRQFCPSLPHTRAEATVFFTRMLLGPTYQPPTPTTQIFTDVPVGAGAPWYSAWVNAAHEAGIIGTCEDIQLREEGMFHPSAMLQRSEGACMMVNALGLNP